MELDTVSYRRASFIRLSYLRYIYIYMYVSIYIYILWVLMGILLRLIAGRLRMIFPKRSGQGTGFLPWSIRPMMEISIGKP